MSDTLAMHGKEYTSSKKAAELSGYARDYIGQLSRGGLVDAQRVGGLWYVSMDSLLEYQKNAEIAKSQVPQVVAHNDAESVVNFEGRDYISASRASKLTGYNQDYVGQLARGGKIPSRQIGNRWYVDKEALVAHKTEKDALLAAVQAQAVGLRETVSAPEVVHTMPQLTYLEENRDLLPMPSRPEGHVPHDPFMPVHETRERSIPIRTISTPAPMHQAIVRATMAEKPLQRPSVTRKRGGKALAGTAMALTIVIVLSYGVASLREGSLYTVNMSELTEMASQSAASVAAIEAIARVGDIIENIVSPELRFDRQ